MTNNWDKIKNIASGLKGLTTIGISDIIGNAISAVFWLYMASLLGAEEYGQVSYFIAIGGIVSTISLTGAANTLTVYTAKNIKIESTIYITSLIVTSISAIVISVIFYNLGIIAYVFGAVIFGLGSSEILGKKMYKSYSKYVIAQKLLMVGLAIGFYHLIGINGLVLGLGLAFLPYTFRLYRGFKETKIDFSLLRKHYGFITNNYVLTLSGIFSGQLDKIVIVPILGFVILGNYQLGIQLLAILEMLPAMIFKFILPHDATGNPNKKLKKVMILSSVSLAVIGVVVSPVIIPIFFPKFIPTIQIFQIVSLSIIPSTIGLTLISKFLGLGKSKFVLISSVIYTAIQIILILSLGKLYGVNGVATAFVISISIQTIILLFIDRFILEKINRRQ
jgi:O-antigen/teichoic acid export membrane protein